MQVRPVKQNSHGVGVKIHEKTTGQLEFRDLKKKETSKTVTGGLNLRDLDQTVSSNHEGDEHIRHTGGVDLQFLHNYTAIVYYYLTIIKLLQKQHNTVTKRS